MITITRQQIKKVLISKITYCSDYYFYHSNEVDKKNLIVSPEKFADFILNHKEFSRFLSGELKEFEMTGMFKPFSWENDLTKLVSKIAKDYPDYKLIRKTIKDRIDKDKKEMRDKMDFFWDIQRLEKAGYEVIPPKKSKG